MDEISKTWLINYFDRDQNGNDNVFAHLHVLAVIRRKIIDSKLSPSCFSFLFGTKIIIDIVIVIKYLTIRRLIALDFHSRRKNVFLHSNVSQKKRWTSMLMAFFCSSFQKVIRWSIADFSYINKEKKSRENVFFSTWKNRKLTENEKKKENLQSSFVCFFVKSLLLFDGIRTMKINAFHSVLKQVAHHFDPIEIYFCEHLRDFYYSCQMMKKFHKEKGRDNIVLHRHTDMSE